MKIQGVALVSNIDKSLKPLEAIGEEALIYQTKNPMTYEEYLKLPEEPGIRHEVINGNLVREPSPSVTHQRISSRLNDILRNYFQKADPEGELFYAPLDVVISEETVVQPDLLYIPGHDQAALQEIHIFIVPQLVVEILSPSTKRKDRLDKMEVYRTAGVPHYWIVDPDACIIEAYLLKDQFYQRVGLESDEVFEHPEFPGLIIEHDKIFLR